MIKAELNEKEALAAKKKQQVTKKKTVDDTTDGEWLPIPPVTIETDDPFKMQCKFCLTTVAIAAAVTVFTVTAVAAAVSIFMPCT